jgi:glycosyltransferase involved in cell wall biosynthesis
MRVLVDITVLEWPLSGVGRSILGLYQACVRQNNSWQIAGIHRGRLACIWPEEFRDIRWARRIPGRLWRRVALPLYIGLTQAEVIHFPWNGGVVPAGRSRKTVMTLHDLIPLVLPEFHFRSLKEEESYRQEVQANLERADLVITDSECSKNDILKYFKTRAEPKVVYYANTLPKPEIPEDEKPLSPRDYFFYSGGYDRRKGLDQLVRVYQRLFAEKIVHCPLVTVGETIYFSEKFRTDLSAAKASGAVIEKGYVNDLELAGWLRGARALIYPSLYEGFGYPPLEALAQGCPVITTKVSSIPEVCGEAAFYIAPGNDEELARAIIAVDRDEGLRQALRRRGLEQAKKFSWERSARTYVDALAKLN